MADIQWYEVDRVGDLQGNSQRVLLIGSLGGTMTHRIPLGSLSADQREGGTESFAWTDPQVDGVFDGAALVWGRDGRRQSIEAVDLRDGSMTHVADGNATVQVATADAALSRVFFITVDEASNQPTGLWTQMVGDQHAPRKLAYDFSEEPVSNRFRYRLAASADGSLLAVQPDEGPIAIIEVDTGPSGVVEPGGPMLGFAGDALVSFGPQSGVVVFDSSTLNGTVLITGVDSAQTVPGTDCLLAIMRVDPGDPRSFEIHAVTTGGLSDWVYSQPPDELGPLLTRPDRTFLRIDPTPGWVLLGDSFFPFIQLSGQLPKNVPESQYPKLLNVVTGEVIRLGPFIDESE